MRPHRSLPGGLPRAALAAAAFALLLLLGGWSAPAVGARPSGSGQLTAASSVGSGANLRITSNAALTSDLFCHNLYVSPGVVLTSDGYLIACTGNVDIAGSLDTGLAAYPTPGSATASNLSESYGGSGGGGLSNACSAGTGVGYSTRAPGGNGSSSLVYNATNGSSAALPSHLSESTLRGWALVGISNLLDGAAGETVCTQYSFAIDYGGQGGYGAYVQGNRVYIAHLNSSGGPGYGRCSGYGISGSGGGGSVVIAYGPGGYFPGTYTLSGGGGETNCANTMWAGSGGNGSLGLFRYGVGGVPIPVPGPVDFAAEQGSGSCVTVGGALFGDLNTTRPAVTVLWNDGKRSSGSFPLHHTYRSTGRYTAAALVTTAPTTGSGINVVGYDQLVVPAPSGAAPRIDLSPVVVDNRTVQLAGVVSLNGCGSAALHPYRVNWGDHSSNATYLPAGHVYAAAGTFRICVTATDSFGNSTKSCTRVTVP